MKKTSFFLFLSCLSFVLQAQELNCRVEINSDQIQGTNKAIFVSLQKAMSEFLNLRPWTEMKMLNKERIECSMTFIVKSYDESTNKLKGEWMVQSRRPVYESSYNSVLLNFRDTQIEFEYQEFDRLELVENSFSSNLTALLAYYANLIIAYDMDSFSRLGGTLFFRAAENIVSAAQSTEFIGWKAFESSKNRYALINNLTDEAFKKFRNYFYEYHRLGLDEMTANAANARARIVEGLPILRDTNRARPSSIAITAFLDAKTDELVNILSQGTRKEKDASYEVLMDLSPTRKVQFDKIKESSF